MPANDWGYQYAQEGNSYIGIATFGFHPDYINPREYMAIKLNDELQPGVDYFWCMYISLLDSVDFASNNIGIGLSTDSITDFTTVSLLNIPICGNHSGIVTDNVNWTIIGGAFLAQGGEKFLYVGNFYTDEQTNVVQLQINAMGGEVAHYYIDNVYLGTSPCIFSSVLIPNIFTPNNDGENDVFFTQDIGIRNKKITLYNRWGGKVFESKSNEVWDVTAYGIQCAEGVYFYIIEYYNIEIQKTEQKKGYLHLLR